MLLRKTNTYNSEIISLQQVQEHTWSVIDFALACVIFIYY